MRNPRSFPKKSLSKGDPEKTSQDFKNLETKISHEILSNFDEFLCPKTGSFKLDHMISKNIRELDAAQHNAGEHSCYFAH